MFRNSLLAVLVALSPACASTRQVDLTPVSQHQPAAERLFFIGQDLDALRGYHRSECCVPADGVTAYMSLYRLLDGADYGGLGYSPDGLLLEPEGNWGAGNVGAWQSATEFGPPHLAVGLFIAENEVPGGLAQIIAGERDAEIAHLAQFMKSVPGQVFLRIGYEFDGTWNTGQDNTENYIGAYRHIVDELRANGVTNGVYVWQAGASIVDDIIEQKHEDIAAWYPGDAYVDWAALSWFTRPDEVPIVGAEYIPATSRTLSDEVVAFARERGKPVMIAEASPQGFDIKDQFEAFITPILDGPSGEGRTPMTADEIWQAWYAPLFDWMNANQDAVKALAYINVDWDSQPMWGAPYESGYWGDSRLETNREIAERFNAAVTAWRAGE